MIFTTKQQDTHRASFIEESRQKAWGAACNADFISKQLDEVIAEYTKRKAEDDQLAADIKELENAVDSHTVDNRQKRKALQEQRTQLAKVMQAMAEDAQKGTQAMQQLLQAVETNLALARHAEEWEWKEMEQSAEGK